MPRKQARYGQPAVYNSTPPTLTDGDDSALNVNASGALITAAGGSGTTADQVQGTAPSDAPVVGNPLLSGGRASATSPTNVSTDGDAVALWTLLNGALAVYNAYAQSKDIDSAAAYIKEADYTTVTASSVVSGAPVALVGYFCSASSSGVCTLYDNASAASGSAHLLSGKTVAANELVMLAHPIKMTAGVYFALGSGTATLRIYTRPLTAV